MVFDRPYAGCYDLFYRDKNYESECDMLEEIFSKRSITPSTIIDLGCGPHREVRIWGVGIFCCFDCQQSQFGKFDHLMSRRCLGEARL